jgi:hypothetical protein
LLGCENNQGGKVWVRNDSQIAKLEKVMPVVLRGASNVVQPERSSHHIKRRNVHAVV